MDDLLQIRIHGEADRPTLIYLPGTHGDWTLIGRFREALGGHFRFIEITYPRTLTWTLQDYAANIESALAQYDVHSGWLLGESFGSQIVWEIAARKHFRADGIILAGGFARHPMRRLAKLAAWMADGIPLGLIVWVMFGYARLIRGGMPRGSPARAELNEFVARRTEADRQAAEHRLRLVARNDPRDIVRRLNIPVFALTGLIDPIVPWMFVRGWMARNCPALKEYRILWADHNVLGSGAPKAAALVKQWIGQTTGAVKDVEPPQTTFSPWPPARESNR